MCSQLILCHCGFMLVCFCKRKKYLVHSLRNIFFTSDAMTKVTELTDYIHSCIRTLKQPNMDGHQTTRNKFAIVKKWKKGSTHNSTRRSYVLISFDIHWLNSCISKVQLFGAHKNVRHAPQVRHFKISSLRTLSYQLRDFDTSLVDPILLIRKIMPRLSPT